MRLLLALIAFQGGSFAQSLSLSSPTVNVLPNQSITVTLSFTDSVPTSNMADVQWTLVPPVGFTPSMPAAIPSTTGTPNPDSVACSAPFTLCIFGGIIPTALSNAPVPSQALITQTFTVGTTAVAGPNVISLNSVLGVNTNSVQVNLTSGTLTVNVVTFAIVLGQALGLTSCTTGDLNGDGKCNVIDVEIAVKTIL